jgi:hypothetical protein
MAMNHESCFLGEGWGWQVAFEHFQPRRSLVYTVLRICVRAWARASSHASFYYNEILEGVLANSPVTHIHPPNLFTNKVVLHTEEFSFRWRN